MSSNFLPTQYINYYGLIIFEKFTQMVYQTKMDNNHSSQDLELKLLWSTFNNLYWNDINNYPDNIENFNFYRFDKIKVLTHLFDIKYSSSFIIYSLMVNNNIWKKLNFNDWIYVIENINRNPEIKQHYLINNSGHLTDLIFLNKYLKIDIVKMLINSNLNENSLQNIFHSIRIISSKFILGRSDKENFEDGTFNMEELNKKHKQLLLEGAELASTNIKNFEKKLVFPNTVS